MRLSDVKDKIDAYFATADPQDIVQRFEDLGYEFENIEPEYSICINYNGNMHRDVDSGMNSMDLNLVEDYVKNGKTMIYSFSFERLERNLLRSAVFDTDTISKSNAVAA